MADDYGKFTGESESSPGFGHMAKVAGRGLVEAVPFYGEKLAEKYDLTKPVNLTERTVERGARNLPYTAPLMIANPVLGTASLLGSTAAGQTAEELGGGPITQAVSEIVGGGVPGLARSVSGKLYGYIDPALQEMTKKVAKSGYEIGPGARTRQGMSYGAGETAEAMERNLTKATKEATSRAGNPAEKIDEKWLNKTYEDLGREVDGIFRNKTFNTTPQEAQAIENVLTKVDTAFGDQANTVRTIIESNLKSSTRPGGAIVGTSALGRATPSQFSAEGLREAISQINAKLGSDANPPQKALLHDLKDVLDNVAIDNLKNINPELAKQYTNWKSKYASYATLDDLYKRFGSSGIDQTGKINLETLRDVISNRSGNAANAIKNPLTSELAEYGDVLRKPKDVDSGGFYQAARQTLKESSIPKAVMGFLQPAVEAKNTGLLRALGVYGPAVSQTTQKTPEGKRDPYHQYTGGQ